jgi:hypothetical protein
MLGFPSICSYADALDFVILQVKYYIYTKTQNNNKTFDFYSFLPFLKSKIDFEYQSLTNKNKNYKKQNIK